MNILAIETATPRCSVALQAGPEIRVRAEHAPRGHATLLLPWIGELLAEAGLAYADLDRIAVGRGPGGFTSLRIGLGVAQGIALAHDLPVAPVSSLAALALAADPEAEHERILALIDARMGEVFVGAFARGPDGPIALGAERVLPPDQLVIPEAGRWLLAGSGLAAYPGRIETRLAGSVAARQPEAWPEARQVLVIGRRINPVPAWSVEPVYVRDNVTS
ncbi:MAG: tRNA (adenosine(37)-N6)-threonylcarbamoyltransferase complex dimerization subunit type 1 TsaB [Wenzhouxiangella sp.]|nr:MAG: tRNA (adenosine(37)-N6)-threonylcarbamoyltransferase complex dimerization subunit type 1 TsaB [Wenzhouxiangella sp.]